MRFVREVRGHGPDMVLLHGWGAGAGVWRELAVNLATRFRVHALNLPGYGGNPACAPYTLERLAESIAAAMPARCFVCGWSLGGQIALACAAHAAQKIERIALISATPCFVQRADWPHAVAEDVLREFAASLATNQAGTLRRFASLQARGDARAREIARRLQAAIADDGPDPAALAQGLEILLDTDLRGRLGRIAQPVLLLHGGRDGLVPPAAAEQLMRGLPRARLERFDAAAHAPFLSEPRAAAALLADFFDER